MIYDYLQKLAISKETANLYLHGGSIIFSVTILEVTADELRFLTTYPDPNEDEGLLIAEIILHLSSVAGLGMVRADNNTLVK